MAVVLLLALEAAALFGTALEPRPGPLLLCTQVAVVHLALLMPALGSIPGVWSAYTAAVAVAVVLLSGFGHTGTAIGGSLALVVSAAASGAAAQRFPNRKLYLASITLVLVLPYACAYLVEEFGRPGNAAAWRPISPLAGASTAAVLLLWAWPVLAVALRRRR